MADLSLSSVLRRWGIDFRDVRADLPLSGSPERAAARWAVESKNGELFVLEQLYRDQFSRREKIGEVLAVLSKRGLDKLASPLPLPEGKFVAEFPAGGYQLSRFAAGLELKRPSYIQEGERGRALADFLIELKKASSADLPLQDKNAFSLLSFIATLHARLQRFDPDVLEKIEGIITLLDISFRKIHDSAPLLFCHGDFHPLNVIWSEESIKAVIDWEFMGIRPEFYDVANLLGCVGSEDPCGLIGELAINFLSTLDNGRYLSPASRRYLPEAVIAMRFAWLAIWLRKRDREMIALELAYLELLRDNIEDLRYSWGG